MDDHYTTKEIEVFGSLINNISKYYFQREYDYVSEKRRAFIMWAWYDITDKEIKKGITWDKFYKKYRLRLKLTVPQGGNFLIVGGVS